MQPLIDGVVQYAKKEDGSALDPDAVFSVLQRLSLINFQPLQSVVGSVQAKLQGSGRRDWSQAYDTLFARFAELSEQDGGGWVTRDTLTQILGTSLGPKRHDFYRHIPLPPNYVERPELLVEVRERLLARGTNITLTSKLTTRRAGVLHGMGGIGKSVLARALCEDEAVRAAFPDGILWTTLGQTPDLTARLREWIETLGGAIERTAPTLDQLRNSLAEALDGKACLLIVDDAWRKEHLEPFAAIGPQSRLLITTRNAAITEALPAEVYPVPVMARGEAVSLLEEWAQGSLTETDEQIKDEIVKELGYLPLAVRLAGAQLRDRAPEAWLKTFDARKIKAKRVESAHDSLELTFGLSLDALPAELRQRYVVLAIFREDEPAPFAASARLWAGDGDAEQVSDDLDDLAARALLNRGRDSGGDSVTVHDLLRDFMAAELGGEGRVAAHRALLESYGKTQTGQGWHTASDDGYLYDHLAYHLATLAAGDARAAAELTSLFADHAWLHARVRQSKELYDGYLADLENAWERVHALARAQIDRDQELEALAACVRCALIRTSINSLAGSYDPSLVVRAVEVGLWPAERGLSVLSLMPENDRRLQGLTKLLSLQRLPVGVRARSTQSALAAAQGIGDARSRARALAALAPQLSGATRDEALRAGLAAAQGIGAERSRAQALAALAPQLSGELLAAGLAAAQGIGAERSRAQALAAFLPLLADPTIYLRETRHDMAYVLRSELAFGSRGGLLSFCADTRLFAPPALNAPTIELVAQHIIDVTTR